VTLGRDGNGIGHITGAPPRIRELAHQVARANLLDWGPGLQQPRGAEDRAATRHACGMARLAGRGRCRHGRVGYERRLIGLALALALALRAHMRGPAPGRPDAATWW